MLMEKWMKVGGLEGRKIPEFGKKCSIPVCRFGWWVLGFELEISSIGANPWKIACLIVFTCSGEKARVLRERKR